MPNAINPDDYNIDKLKTGFLGPILTTDFRDYILGHNLQNINNEIVQGGYNLGGLNVYAGDMHLPSENVQDLPGVTETSDLPNVFTNGVSPWSNNQLMNLWAGNNPYFYTIGNENKLVQPPVQGKTTFVVTTKKLEDPGDTTSWVTKAGGTKTAGEVRNKMVLKSTYGPDYIYAYNCPDVPPQETGYIQYKTFAGGDFRSTILGQQLGFGVGAGIEFDSSLSDIGKDQRKFNLKERIRLNFIGDTLGKLNVDPLGLLAGQDLFLKDYTITQAPGFGGKAAEFTKSLLGFNYPASTIPSWKSVGGLGGDDVNQDLLNNTAEGTKGLLYNAILTNKWGPRFMGAVTKTTPTSKVDKFLSKTSSFFGQVNSVIDSFGGSGEQPSTIRYTDPVTENIDETEKTRDLSLVDKLNQGVKEQINKLITKINPSVVPSESEDPSIPINPIDGDEAYGFNTGYDIEFSDTLEQEYYDGDTYGSKSNKFVVNNNINISHETPLTSDGNLFYWDKNRTTPTANRGLLNYTQKLIESPGKNHGAKYIGIVNSTENINTEKNNRHKVFSQGNRITVGENTQDRVFCRSWSLRNPYSRYEDTIRHSSLTNREPIFSKLSVLEDNGMPKIVPYVKEYENWSKSLHTNNSPSNYMLSIENLAWEGTREFNALPNIEKGPHGGRLMWFPPYDINFTDNSSVNWDTTTFIGRAEPIYTYNNTERTGTLSFTIITDHPSSLNIIRKETEKEILAYFAGCDDLKNTAFSDLINDEEIIEPDIAQVPKPKDRPSGNGPTLTFYFQNGKETPKSSPGRSVFTDVSVDYEINGLNSTFQSDLNIMIEFLLSEDGKRYQIISEGFTSALNVTDYNKVLGLDRATSLQKYLIDFLVGAETEDNVVPYELGSIEGNKKTYPKEINWIDSTLRWANPISKGEVSGSGQGTLTGNETAEEKEAIINNPDAMEARRATIRLIYNPDIDAYMDGLATNTVEEINRERQAEYNRAQQQRQTDIEGRAEKLAREMVNESTYFNKLEVENAFIYDSLKEKVQYFHPAFHSMTPEGLNSRLTFLKQCTRQGPNIAGKEPQNMAFGKPPICVLRIGDFYHTKIVIDTINITYDPLQWDLNPEGIGVQPMLAKIDLNFKFIGGSSLGGPINQLQNAVSHNFFANTSVYNKRKNVTNGKESFDYGSFITPEQVTNTPEQNKKDGTEIKSEEISVTEKSTDAEQEKRNEQINNATDDGNIDDAASKNANPATFETQLSDIPAFMNLGIISEATLKLKDTEIENWDIIEFNMDISGDCDNGDGINQFSLIASDRKSATIRENLFGNCNYPGAQSNYVFHFRLKNLVTEELYLITERVTNNF